MNVFGVFKFRHTRYATDMPTALFARYIGGKPILPDRSNFKTSDMKYLRTADGKIFNVKEA